MPPQVLSGARARLGVVDVSTGITRIMAIYDSVSYGVQLDCSPIFLLGRLTAAALEYTSVEPVQVSCTGWRVLDHGPHKDGAMPRIQDMLQHEYLTLVVVDRLSLKEVAVIRNVRPTGYSTGFAARQLSQMSMTFMGILADTEDTGNTEPPDAVQLPGVVA